MAEYKSSYTGAQIDAGIAKANTAIQDVSDKQDTLVSGTNIKTINGNSVLGSGNLVIEGGGGGLSSVAHDETLTGAGTNETPLGVDTTKIATKSDLNGKQDTIDSSHKLSSDLVDDTNKTNKFVTSSEKTTWSGKQDQLVSGTNIKTINNTSILGSGNIEVGGGSSLPISFSETQPPTDGSVLLWINTHAEEPVGDEITGFNLSGNCTNIEVEDQTELYSRQYQVTATGEYSGYNILGLKKGGVGLNKIEVAPSSLNYDLVTVGYDPNASGANDFSSLILFSITGFKQGFKVKKDGSATEGVNPTVTGTYSNASDPYILESKVVGTSLVLTATKVSSGEQEVQYEWAGLGSTFVPCFGVGANKASDLSMTFKKVV